MAYARIAAVTGANKGIGFAIVRNIALQYPKSSLNNGPLLIYLTARDASRGEQALKDINADSQLRDAKALRSDGGLADIKYHSLDVSSHQSIDAFASFLKKEHPEGIDLLVNNAGVALDGFNGEVVDATLACNYYGVKHMTNTMLPAIKDGGRVVNVASMIGKINKYSPALTKQFESASTEAEMDSLMETWSKAVHAGTHDKDGWPSSAYAVSKTGVIGYTRAVAHHLQKQGRNVLVNSCCPGYVNTDMTKGRGKKTVDQGAATPVKVAVGDIGNITGEFWEHEEMASSPKFTESTPESGTSSRLFFSFLKLANNKFHIQPVRLAQRSHQPQHDKNTAMDAIRAALKDYDPAFYEEQGVDGVLTWIELHETSGRRQLPWEYRELIAAIRAENICTLLDDSDEEEQVKIMTSAIVIRKFYLAAEALELELDILQRDIETLGNPATITTDCNTALNRFFRARQHYAQTGKLTVKYAIIAAEAVNAMRCRVDRNASRR
ncbi:hypothetical protein FH972_022165 [Carpinus fangiana]|uniref:Uncharacterized protein n=1 Tax=Carpinus fangiana TaxID=176857 RepID=A0A5N6KTM9_9ROSI|nr:hypothetical protein FH972_022165 [Carpinus fangiana]